MLIRIVSLIMVVGSMNMIASNAQAPWNVCSRKHTLPKVAMRIDFSGDEAITKPVNDEDIDSVEDMASCSECCCLVQTHVGNKLRDKYVKQQCYNPLTSLTVVLHINGDVEEVPNLRVKIPTSPTNAPAICSPAKN